MKEIQPDMSNANRCISVHWSLPTQCERDRTHFDFWHWARHPDSGAAIRYRRTLGVYRTEELRDGQWHALPIPAPEANDVPTLTAKVRRLQGLVEEHMSALVAASERRVYFEAKSEELGRKLDKATRFEVDMLPEDDINAGVWKITVEYRGRGKWAVLRGGHFCLGTDGVWDWEPTSTEREDEWLAAHRFDLDAALQLAEEHAPKLTVNGRTAADLLARDAERGEP